MYSVVSDCNDTSSDITRRLTAQFYSDRKIYILVSIDCHCKRHKLCSIVLMKEILMSSNTDTKSQIDENDKLEQIQLIGSNKRSGKYISNGNRFDQ